MRTISATESAKYIRTDLKTTYPGVKFTVRSRYYSGGNAVDIGWTDGPSTKQVDSLMCKYEEGTFNGMIDLYEYSDHTLVVNGETVSPGVMFVQVQRRYSYEFMAVALAEVLAKFGWEHDNKYSVDDLIKKVDGIRHWEDWQYTPVGHSLRICDTYLSDAVYRHIQQREEN